MMQHSSLKNAFKTPRGVLIDQRPAKETEYMVRLRITKTGRIKLRTVEYLARGVEKSGPFKGCRYTSWKPVPAALRRELAEATGATLTK